ncbi:hypothetical protein ACFX5Q_32845 [Mesorhizobium sp. IMUNJ 23033]|uniref:TRAFAC clade GTPase domain-containing protein n=1 Tax=Mesorhizobium sp. IMUNJ 23033 TaxID=3378039 RepID=UPI00384D8CF8
MRGPCTNTTCTFNATRTCVLGNPPEECSNRSLIPDDSDDTALAERISSNSFADHEKAEGETLPSGSSGTPVPLGGAVLPAPDDDLPVLPASRTLGIPQANAMMESRPTCMVGIVGLAGAGKTAALVSAYLLLSRDQFAGYSYADSDTLRAFEEIAGGSRTWQEGSPPEQITSHTTLSNDREAGFLHLRLWRHADDRLLDVLLPDLPGEWSQALIGRNDAERLHFLRSASVIWLMIDGRQFADDHKVMKARFDTKLLIERLANLLEGRRPRILVVPTWQDRQPFPQAEADELIACGGAFGFKVEVVPIASFSWSDDMIPGYGVADLFDRSFCVLPPAPAFWPVTEAEAGDRRLHAFRRRP